MCCPFLVYNSLNGEEMKLSRHLHVFWRKGNDDGIVYSIFRKWDRLMIQNLQEFFHWGWVFCLFALTFFLTRR